MQIYKAHKKQTVTHAVAKRNCTATAGLLPSDIRGDIHLSLLYPFPLFPHPVSSFPSHASLSRSILPSPFASHLPSHGPQSGLSYTARGRGLGSAETSDVCAFRFKVSAFYNMLGSRIPNHHSIFGGKSYWRPHQPKPCGTCPLYLTGWLVLPSSPYLIELSLEYIRVEIRISYMHRVLLSTDSSTQSHKYVQKHKKITELL